MPVEGRRPPIASGAPSPRGRREGCAPPVHSATDLFYRRPSATIFPTYALSRTRQRFAQGFIVVIWALRRQSECNLWRSLGMAMTRASAPNGDAYPVGPAEILSGETAFRFAEAWAHRPTRAPKRAHARVPGAAGRRRRVSAAVLAGLAFAIVCVVALVAQHLRVERDLALSAGAREVDMRATLLAERLSAALSADPQASEAKAFRSILNAHPDERLANRCSSTARAEWSNMTGRRTPPN